MSLTSTTNRADFGVTSATNFPFNFKVFDATDIEVTRTDSTGAITTVSPSLYTVNGVGADVGSIDYPTHNATDLGLVIMRTVDLTQPTRLRNQGDFFADVIEKALDRVVMITQQLTERMGRSVGFAAGSTSSTDMPEPSEGTVLGWVGGKLRNLSAATAQLAADLLSSAVGKGTSLITYLAPHTGAVATTQSQVNSEIVSAFRFMSAAQIADVIAGTLTLDVTTPLQNWINAISSATQAGAKRGFLPAGKYKTTSALSCPSRFITIGGEGMWKSQIIPTGAIAGIKPAAISAFSPVFSDFSVLCDASGLIALDLSSVTSVTYNGALERLQLIGGTDGLYAGCNGTANCNFFSMKLDGVISSGISGHAFRLYCGPGVQMINCYAVACGSSKAGYRIAGSPLMLGCNGIDSGGWWGVFGQRTAASDGFQNDFPGAGDLPSDVNLYGCNVEHFTVGGVQAHNTYRNFNIFGGSIDRSFSSAAYDSLVKLAYGPVVNGTPARIGFSSVFPGSGVPNGGLALTNAWIYAPTAQPGVVDTSGALGNASIPGVYTTAYGAIVPFLTQGTVNDVYNDIAHSFNAITARRLSIQMQRYAVPAALTPVGAGQAINVTGYTKVIVTPVSAASITTATFNQASLIGTDYYRNGDLIVEAGNANLTINHSASGNYTFRMAAGANLTLTAGQVVRFCWSSTSNQWIQV